MQRYFIKEAYEPKNNFLLKEENYHHMIHVMRMTVGQQIYLVFENQLAILAEIIEITDSEVKVIECSKEQSTKELPIQVTIASGYPKGDKLEWIIQKGTELGCYQFIGFPARTSVVKWDQKKLQKKEQRLEKIAMEAAEQSHRQAVPGVKLLEKELELIEGFSDYDKIVVAYEDAAKTGEQSHFARVLSELSFGQRLLVIFGPEGGFSKEEIELFTVNKAEICGLGPRILRTETAPLYVLSAISYQFELV